MIQGQTIFEYKQESATGQAVKHLWEKAGETLGLK